MSKSPVAQLGLAMAGVGLALFLRWIIDRGASGVEMATFCALGADHALAGCRRDSGAQPRRSIFFLCDSANRPLLPMQFCFRRS